MAAAPASTKRLVCLANSRKLNGRCVAGIELVDGAPVGWVRPVSARPAQEVSEYERQYEDGSDPSVLDVMDVPVLRRAPHLFQTENWLLNPECYWAKVGRMAWTDLSVLAKPAGSLWINGHSTYSGENDRIPLELAESLDSSLVLVHVPEISIRVFAPGEAFGNPKRRVQARFRWAGIT